MSKEGVINREKLITELSNWLYLEDLQAIDILYGAVLSHYLSGEPVWLFLIGPPGGTKTELLRALKGNDFYTISSLTPQTLISGLNSKNEVDLLPHLNRKILVVKDFTTILSRDSKEQAQIFADLRDCYDGYLEKAFGSGVGKKSYHAKFDLIAGVTPAIDMYRVVHGVLGERFLKCRIHINETKAIDKAAELLGREDEMRISLSESATECIAYYQNSIKELPLPEIDNNILDQIKALGNITAKLRSEVARDRYHTVLYYPQAEVGTRLTKQLLKLGHAISVFHEHERIDKDDLECLIRVARDSIPKQRLEIVEALVFEEGFSDSTHIGEASNTPTQTAKETMEELWMFKLLERQGSSTFQWRLNEKTRDLIVQSCVFLETQTRKTPCMHA
jgi:hypothetical protein